ncbi:zinc ribbon-containing protein [Agaribacterium haliotis]|uniref:zinc ribbon-containing protein n=1 Tax=Agaribacterium haliotis TaxID=2013869 RepID=UPI000BB57634|nr:hypothetical protein [Agaribacterium haliotis]
MSGGESKTGDAHGDGKLAELYEKLSDKTKEFYAESSEKSLAALETALEKARVGLEKAGELSRQEGQKLKLFVRRDLEQAAAKMKGLGAQTRDQVVEPAINKAEEGFFSLTHHLAHNASEAFARLADWADTSSVYHTGQVTSAGTLRCLSCGKEMQFKKTANIPPCPSCHKTDFERAH